MSRPIVLVGGGGHASVIYSMLTKLEQKIAAVLSPQPVHSNIKKLFQIETDQELEASFRQDEINLVNCVGSLPFSMNGAKTFHKYSEMGYSFVGAFSRDAIIDGAAKVSESAVIMAGSVIQSNSIIESNVVINTGAIIEHDCNVSQNVHVAPGAVLCGGVKLGNTSFVGAGAVIINSITIGKNVVIAAGATVVHDVPDDHIYIAPSKIERLD